MIWEKNIKSVQNKVGHKKKGWPINSKYKNKQTLDTIVYVDLDSLYSLTLDPYSL